MKPYSVIPVVLMISMIALVSACSKKSTSGGSTTAISSGAGTGSGNPGSGGDTGSQPGPGGPVYVPVNPGPLTGPAVGVRNAQSLYAAILTVLNLTQTQALTNLTIGGKAVTGTSCFATFSTVSSAYSVDGDAVVTAPMALALLQNGLPCAQTAVTDGTLSSILPPGADPKKNNTLSGVQTQTQQQALIQALAQQIWGRQAGTQELAALAPQVAALVTASTSLSNVVVGTALMLLGSPEFYSTVVTSPI